MIRMCAQDRPLFLSESTESGIAACAIETLHKLYADDPKMALFWDFTCDNPECGAIILALFDHALYLCPESDFIRPDDLDWDELAEMIRFFSRIRMIEGPSSLLAPLAAALHEELRCHAVFYADRPLSAPDRPDLPVDRQVALSDMYTLLQKCFGGSSSREGYLRWMTDTSLRIRRGFGLLYGIYAFGQLTSGCGSYYRCDKYAVISGVATLPEFRSRGMAHSLVRAMAGDIIASGKTALLAAAEPELEPFYLSLGFRPGGSYGTIVLS